MLLLELAVQAVRGFSPSARVALKPGFVVLKCPGEPAPLGGLLTVLCYPDGRGGEASYLAAGQRSGKAGFSFQAHDQSVWRLVRDLGGVGSLHKLNAATKAYEVVTQDAAQMQQLLRQAVGLPPRTTFEQLFTLTPSQFPTRRPKAHQIEQKKGALARKKAGVDLAAEEQRAEALKAELVKARETGELQFKIDGLTNDLYKLDARLRGFEELRARVAAAHAELANAPTPERLGFPSDIVERVKRYELEKKKYREAIVRVNEEREQATASAGQRSVPPLYRDNRFVASVVVGLLCVVGGGLADGVLRYLAVLAIAPFTFAALLSLRYIEDLQAAARSISKSDVYDVRQKKIDDDWALYEAQVNAAMEAVSVATRDDFYAAMEKPEALKTTVAELDVQFAELQVDPDNADREGRSAGIKAELEELNASLIAQSGGYARSEAEITRDLNRVQELIERAREPQVEQFTAVPAVPVEVFDDPTPPLMLLAADLFASNVPTLWGQLKDRAVQYLTALTDRRYFGAEVEKDGKASVQAAGRRVPVGELPGKDLDAWYLALRLTIIEKYSSRARVPAVIEDGFSGLIDDLKLPLVTRMLKHLGTLTQVLHVVGAGREASADPGNVFDV